MKSRIAILSLIFLISLYSCKKEKRPKEIELNIGTKIDTLDIQEKLSSSIRKDSTLKALKMDLLLVYSEKKIDTLRGFCNCEKNVKKNTLKIQIRTEFPSLSELEKGNRNASEFQMGIDRQYRFLTFYLRDSIVERTKIIQASTETQFDGKKTDSISIQNYKININRFDFKIAQKVWGNYEIELSSPFGFRKNDKKIEGTFHCNNWKIVEYTEVHEWTKKGKNYIE